jgi:tRNA-2-methylthio-N6-dimethylallyladenosine synthase
MAKQVPDAVNATRLDALQALLDQQTKAFDRVTVGRDIDLLFERPGRDAGQLVGRSPYMQAAFVEAPASLLGSIRRVRVTDARGNSLAAELLPDDPAIDTRPLSSHAEAAA